MINQARAREDPTRTRGSAWTRARSSSPAARSRPTTGSARASSTGRRSSATSTRRCGSRRRRSSGRRPRSSRSRDVDEAIRVSNGIEYGLSSSIFTRDVNAAFRAMRDLEAGITYVNAGTIGAEVHLPVRRHEGHRQRPPRGGPGGARRLHRVEVDLRRLLGPAPARPDRHGRVALLGTQRRSRARPTTFSLDARAAIEHARGFLRHFLDRSLQAGLKEVRTDSSATSADSLEVLGEPLLRCLLDSSESGSTSGTDHFYR